MKLRLSPSRPRRAATKTSVASLNQAAAYLKVFPQFVENELLLGNLPSLSWAEVKRFQRNLLARRRRALARCTRPF